MQSEKRKSMKKNKTEKSRGVVPRTRRIEEPTGEALAQPIPPDSDPQNLVVADALAKDIGKRLVTAREGLGFSQQAVSVRSKRHDPDKKGISRSVLSMYETGVNRPGAREIRILCETLKITPNWILYGTESPAKALQASLEFLQGDDLSISVRLAFAMLALEPEERDSLASLLFALVGRKLGDIKLTALMSMANHLQTELLKNVLAEAGEHNKEAPFVAILDAYVKRASEGYYSNYGNLRPVVRDDDFDPFEQDPPPPRSLK